MATNTHSPLRGARRRALASLLAVAGATALASLASAPTASAARAYGWPVKPFFKQHPVRGFFGDPRGHADGRSSPTLHFGVDVSAPDGTPVYATLSGRIYRDPVHSETVHVRADDGTTVFSYWHIVPTVRTGQRATAYRTVVGRIARGWEHVHFSESYAGRHLNPLRRGAMTPYADRTTPVVKHFGFEQNGGEVGRTIAGRVDMIAEAYDQPPMPTPRPWTGKPVAPAFIRWRVVGRRGVVVGWRTTADFRSVLPTDFDAIYARWTRQNHPWRAGRYRFRLATRWDSRTVRDGTYRLDVGVADTRGNRSRSSVRFVVDNRREGGGGGAWSMRHAGGSYQSASRRDVPLQRAATWSASAFPHAAVIRSASSPATPRSGANTMSASAVGCTAIASTPSVRFFLAAWWRPIVCS